MASTKKPVSQKKVYKEKDNDNKILNRIYFMFLLGFVAECYLFLVYRGYTASSVASMLVWHKVLIAGKWLGLAAMITGAVGAYLKREDKKLRTILSCVGGAGVFFAVTGWLITHFFTNGAGITISCVLTAAAAILALVLILYQHECTLITAALIGAMFTVWARGGSFLSNFWAVPVIIGCVLGLALVGGAAYLCSMAQKDEGKLRKIQVFSPDCDYRILYAGLAVAAAGVLIVLLVPSISVYLMWLMAVALFAELIYYTTKLM